ncbi:tape measure protein [Arthrobacter phage SWEP2]|uniref:Tape measure protein n=1 Tax=Arthrobacter phage SWEP2 TaxID=2945958 RepID=A0A9E7MJ15_9CAUD|nr:tape measure protein [Arthrobacter phage SWEP2]
MSNVGYATLTILPSAKNFRSALNREVGGDLDAVGRSGGQRASRGFGATFIPGFKSLFGPAVGVAAGAALGAGIKSGLATAGFMEQAMISFETLLGDSGKAKQMLADVSKFAANTPFELPGLTANVRSLLGAGAAYESVLPTMTALGDANAALGGSQENLNSVVRAWTQIQGKGKVSAEEMLQITEAGIPIWTLLSKAMGKPVGELQKLASDGKLLAGDVLPLLEQQMNKDYGGSMEKQAKTLNGVWSTVKDTVNMAMAEALQPLVPILTTILPPAANALAGAIRWVSDAVVGLSSLIVGGDFTGALGRLFNIEEDHPAVGVILNIRQAVIDFFTSIQSGTGPASSILTEIGNALRPIGDTIQNTILPALGLLATAFVTGIQPVLQVVGEIVTGSIIPAFQQMAAQAGPLFTQVGTTISTVAQQIGPILQGVANVIQTVWGFIGPFVISTIQGIFGNVVGVFSGILTVIQGVVNLVAAIFTGDWAAAWNALGQIVSGAVQAVWNFFQLWIMGRLVAVAGAALGAIRGLFSGAWSAVTGVVQGAVSAVMSTVGWLLAGLRGVVSGGMSAVRGFFSSAWSSITGAVSGAVNGIMGAVSGGIGNVVGVVASLPGRAMSALGGIVGQFGGIGRDMIAGLANGIRNAAGMIRDAVAGAIGNVVDFAKSLLGIHSPSRVFMQIGHFTGQGMAIGLTRTKGLIQKASDALIPKAPTVAMPTVQGGGVQGAIVSSAAAFAGRSPEAPLIGELTIQSSGNVREDVEEAMFHVRRIARGGVYA